MRDDAPGGDEDGPEVERVASFEGREDFEVDEERHVDGQGEHGDEYGGARCVLWERTAFDATVCGSWKDDHLVRTG